MLFFMFMNEDNEIAADVHSCLFFKRIKRELAVGGIYYRNFDLLTTCFPFRHRIQCRIEVAGE